MKKILFLLVALLLAGLAPVSAGVADAVLEWDACSTITAAAKYDSLLKTADSITIMAKTSAIGGRSINDGGWTYYLQLARLTGASKDTSIFRAVVDGYTFNDSLIGRVHSDTSTDHSETIMLALPIGSCIADKYAIKILSHGTGDNTMRTVFNGPIRIVRSRPLNRNANRP